MNMEALLAKSFAHEGIRASAGTGKTFALANRFIGLLAAGAEVSSILATTFTRKAAGEILDRVLTRLCEASQDEGKCEELSKFIKVEGFGRRQTKEILFRLIRQLHRVQSCTLDSFFASLAGSFPFELGMPPGWHIIDESLDQQLRTEAIRAMLSTGDSQELVTMIRLLVRDHAARPVAEQIRRIVGDLYRIYTETPEQSWNALKTMPMLSEEWVADAVERLAEFRIPTNTNGKENANWVKQHGRSLGYAVEGDWLKFLTDGISGKIAAGSKSYYRLPIENHHVEVYHPLIVHARAWLTNRTIERTRAIHQLLSRFDAAYQELKTIRRALQFEDVTRSLANGVAMRSLDDLFYRLDGRIHHLLLDEFQDTSLSQWRIIQPMAEEIVAHGEGDRSLFCVGDAKQAIYGWRGGEAAIFETMESDLPGVVWRPLNLSFRSSQVIIDVVNRVFESIGTSPALERYEKAAQSWGERFSTHETAMKELPGYVQAEVAPIEVGTRDGIDEYARLRYTARRIKKIVRDAPNASVGVLLRSNNKGQIARLVHELGRDTDGGTVRASEEGGNPLTDSPAVNAVLSWLTLADHPGDTVARFHVETSCLGTIVGLGRADAKSGRRLGFKELTLGLRERLVRDGYAPTIFDWTKQLAERCDEHDLRRLLQLTELAAQYDRQASLRPCDFVRFVKIQKVEDATPANVRIMTIHKSKGLQFDAVVLPQLDGRLGGGKPPEVVSKRCSEDLETEVVCSYLDQATRKALPHLVHLFDEYEQDRIFESLSVMYVALTRAKQAIYLIMSPSKQSEKKLPATMEGVLRGALIDETRLGCDDGVVYQHGSDQWGESILRKVPDLDVEHESRSPVLAKASARRRRGLPRQSPSRLEGGDKVTVDSILNFGHRDARKRGTILHALFETIEWVDDWKLEDKELVEVAVKVGCATDESRRMVEEFRAMVRQPHVRACLSRPDCDELHVLRESSFAIRTDDAITQGVVDRLILFGTPARPSHAEVIDFKTDYLETDDDLASRVSYYRPQIEAYRHAVESLYGLDAEAVSAKLVFVMMDRVMDM